MEDEVPSVWCKSEVQREKAWVLSGSRRARCRLCCSTLPRIARSRGSSFVCLEIQCERQTRNKRDLDALAALPRPRVGVIFIHPFSREAAARLRQDICQRCWLRVSQASRWSCMDTGCSTLLQQVETSPALPDIFASWRWMMSFFWRVFSFCFLPSSGVFPTPKPGRLSEELASCLSHNITAVYVTCTLLGKHKQAVLEIPVFMSRCSLLI